MWRAHRPSWLQHHTTMLLTSTHCIDHTVDRVVDGVAVVTHPTLSQGVVVYFRVVDGSLRKGDTIKLMNTRKEYEVTEVGVLAPKQVEVRTDSQPLGCVATGHRQQHITYMCIDHATCTAFVLAMWFSLDLVKNQRHGF